MPGNPHGHQPAPTTARAGSRRVTGPLRVLAPHRADAALGSPAGFSVPTLNSSRRRWKPRRPDRQPSAALSFPGPVHHYVNFFTRIAMSTSKVAGRCARPRRGPQSVAARSAWGGDATCRASRKRQTSLPPLWRRRHLSRGGEELPRAWKLGGITNLWISPSRSTDDRRASVGCRALALPSKTTPGRCAGLSRPARWFP